MRLPAWRCLSALEPEMHRASRFPLNTAIWVGRLARGLPMPRCWVSFRCSGPVASAQRLRVSLSVRTQTSMRQPFFPCAAHSPSSPEQDGSPLVAVARAGFPIDGPELRFRLMAQKSCLPSSHQGAKSEHTQKVLSSRFTACQCMEFQAGRLALWP